MQVNHIVTLYNMCLWDQVAKYTERGHSDNLDICKKTNTLI